MTPRPARRHAPRMTIRPRMAVYLDARGALPSAITFASRS